MSNTKHKTSKHIHRFIHVGPGWKCANPDCRFFVYDRQATLAILGNSTICWNCGVKFGMDEESIQMEMPQCSDCRNVKYKEIADTVELDSLARMVKNHETQYK